MTEIIPNTYVSCTCEVCGAKFERQAYRMDYTSITEQEAYNSTQRICDACIEKSKAVFRKTQEALLARQRRKERLARRTTAQDIIREHNLRHKNDKKGKHRK